MYVLADDFAGSEVNSSVVRLIDSGNGAIGALGPRHVEDSGLLETIQVLVDMVGEMIAS